MGLASAWKPGVGLTDETTATRSGSRPGGRRKRKALTILNIVALTAMPRARVTTAAAVNPGFFNSIRMARRKSLRRVSMDTPHLDICRIYGRGQEKVHGRNGPARCRPSARIMQLKESGAE